MSVCKRFQCIKMRYKKGISLITLVITIIVVIILATAIILAMSNNNPFDAAHESVFKGDLDNFRTELELYKSGKYLDTNGSYNMDTLQADTNTIGDIINSLKNNTKYQGKMQIEKGQLIFICTGTMEDTWAEEIGITVKCIEPEILISEAIPLVVNSQNDVNYTATVLSSYPIASIDEPNVKLYRVKDEGQEQDTEIAQDYLTFNYTYADGNIVNPIGITVDTGNLTDGSYYLKALPGAVLIKVNEKNVANTKESQNSGIFEVNNVVPRVPDIVPSTTNITNQNITASITFYDDNKVRKYKVGDANWVETTEDTVVLTITENIAITAVGINNLGTQNSFTLNIANIDKTPPSVPTVTYNGGANTNTWKNNYNLTVVSTDNIGVAKYQIDWNKDGGVDSEFTGTSFIPSNGYDSAVTRFRAVDTVGNIGNWSGENQIHMDTQAPVHTNWWWGTATSSGVSLYIQATDNIGIQRVQGPTSTETGGYSNWVWFDAVWDSGANAYRVDILQSAFGHIGNYITHLYMYDYAGNGGYYNQTGAIYIPSAQPPTSWRFFQAITVTTNWTVPTTGWYKIHVIGRGGTGGIGGRSDTYSGSSTYWLSGGGGSGAAGGGLAISTAYLTAGTTISAIVDSTYTSFGTYGTAYSGRNGNNGGNPRPEGGSIAGDGGAKLSGTGGTATGGNAANVTGGVGTAGSNGGSTPNGCGNCNLPDPLGGYGSPKLAESIYYAPQAARGQSAVTSVDGHPVFGGGGGGGNGSGAFNYPSIGTPGHTGGIGAPAGIVIESAN